MSADLSILGTKSGLLSISLAPKAPENFEGFNVFGYCFELFVGASCLSILGFNALFFEKIDSIN